VAFTSSGYAEKKKPKAENTSYAVIAGSVFRPPGFALPEADVVLSAATPDEGGQKWKPMKTKTDARGEFAFRVPPVPMRYVVSVKRSGYAGQQKDVSVEGEQRRDLSFLLDEEPKQK
jgi:hypothetical protein